MSFQAPQPFLSLPRLAGFMFACLLLLTGGQAVAASVLVILSDSTSIYQTYAQTFKTSLEKRNPDADITVTDLAQLNGRALPDASLLVAVGSRAAESMLQRDNRAPLVLTLLPRENLERIAARTPKATGVYIDQPASRYIALVRAALPNTERVGLLSGRDSRAAVNRLTTAAREQRLRVQIENIPDETELFPPLRKLIANDLVLIATPDATIYNAQTIPSILISTFRRRIPVVGFSAAYVNAGAVVALYSTPEQLATQSAEMSHQILAGGAIPAPQHPRQYTIGINDRVARSLGLTLDSEAVIRERLERQERQP